MNTIGGSLQKLTIECAERQKGIKWPDGENNDFLDVLNTHICSEFLGQTSILLFLM